MPVTGIIRPPPEIRAVADKTALFVAKNGRAFEQRILNSDKGQTPKFAFLHESSPFHAYYEDRIIFYQEGGTDDPKEDENKSGKQEQKKEDVITTAVIKKPAQQHEKKSALDPVAKALHKQRNIIRAQYEQAEKEARDSKGNDSEDAVKSTPVVITPPVLLSFVHITAPGHVTVAQVETIKLVAQFTALDESKNFLQNLTMREWNNPAFGFLQPRHAHFAYFSALTDSYKQILQIGFRKGDDEPAMSIEECLDLAAYRAEYEQDAEQRQENNGDDQDEGNAIDWHDFVVVETIDFAKDEVIQPISMPGEVNEMDESDEEGETIRVVPSYTPRVVASNEADKSMTHVIDPITGKSVPVSQTSEHMRIQLLDPKWAEERKKFQEKQKESNLVSGDVIAANLSRVVGDFASTAGLHTESKRRLEESNRAIHDNSQPGPVLLPPQEPPVKRPRIEPPLPPPLPPGFPPVPGAPLSVHHQLPLPAPSFAPSLPPPPPGFPPGMLTPPVPPPGIPPGAGVSSQPFDPLGAQPTQLQDEPQLIPASEFAASLESPIVTLEIGIPKDQSNMAWNFYGQTASVRVDVMSKVKAAKEELSKQLNNISINKLQLRHSSLGFLKDSQSFADLNLGGLVSLEMVPKTRGGRVR